MNSDSGAGWRLGGVGPGLPLLLLLVFANFLGPEKTGLRPSFEGGARPALDEVENLPARLWRDPLGAVYSGLAKASSTSGVLAAPAPVALGALHASFGSVANDGAISLVPVLIPGSVQPEDVELRVRMRHALVAALGTQGLLAESTDHLGFVQVERAHDWRPQIAQRETRGEEPNSGVTDAAEGTLAGLAVEAVAVNSDSALGTCVLPFEWYAAKTGERALVLWFDEAVLGSHPLLSLHGFLERVVPPDWRESATVRVDMIGPSNSDVLIGMVADDRWLGEQEIDWEPWWTDAWLTSPRSTVDPKTIMGSKSKAKDVRVEFPSSGLRFERTIGTDAELASLLVKELMARLHPFRPVEGLSRWTKPLYEILRFAQFERPRRSDPIRVALVTERDSSYGRAWERLLGEAVEELNLSRHQAFLRSQVREIVATAFQEAADQVEDDEEANVHAFVRSGLHTAETFEGWMLEALGEAEGPIDREWRRLLTERRVKLIDPLLEDRTLESLELNELDGSAESLSRDLRERVRATLGQELWSTPGSAQDAPGRWIKQAYRELVSTDSDGLERILNGLRAGPSEPDDFELLSEHLEVRFDRAGEPAGFALTEADSTELESLTATHLESWFVRNRWSILDCYAEGAWHDPFVQERVREELLTLPCDKGLKHAGDAFAQRVERELDHQLEIRLRSWWRGYAFDFRVAARYLRGIDGRIPGDQRTAVEPGQEPAIGEAQLDYVRRLERLFEGQDFHAIGILGNDVYDKLAMTAVLRSRFRTALFFTTDVDARLLPSRANQSTLNLIVASHYGLVLDPEHQEGHPPFRSGYQASVYLAAQRVAKRIVPAGHRPNVQDAPESDRADLVESVLRQDKRQFVPKARIYEAGRTWFHPLQEFALDGRDRSSEILATDERGRVPPTLDANQDFTDTSRVWLFQRDNLLGLVFAALVALFCFGHSAWIWNRFSAFVRAMDRRLLLWSIAFGLAAVFGVSFLYGRMRLESNGAGEPLRVIEGISAWPTVWIRVGMIGLCHFGLLFCAARLARVHESLAAWFKGPRPDPVWSRFERTSGFRRLVRWALFSTLVYYVLTGQVFRFLGGDIAPTRGEENYVIERFVLWISVLWLLFLLFFIVHLMIAVRSFVRETTGRSLRDWNLATLNRLQERTGLDREAAAATLPTLLANDLGRRTQGLIWLPALAMFGMVVSRASLFDRWDWPPALVFTLSLSFLITLFAGHHVRQAAMRARRVSLSALQSLRMRALGDDVRVSRLEVQIAELENLRSGTFAPILAHPLLRAWLLPIAGLGTNTILEVLLPKVVG